MKKIFLFKSLSAAFLLSSVQATEVFQNKPHAVSSQERLDIGTKIKNCREILALFAHDNAQVLAAFDASALAWQSYYQQKQGQFDIDTLLKAVSFAAIKHQGQTRKDAAATPYIVHPIGVAQLLWNEGKVRSVNVLAASLLHDILEDTETTTEEFISNFGNRIYQTVMEVTNDPKLSSDENKQRQVDHAPSMSLDAQLVKLADRLYNIQDLRNPPPSWDSLKVQQYLQWGDKLLKALPGTNEELERALASEIQALKLK